MRGKSFHLHQPQSMNAFDLHVWQEIQYLDSQICDHENFTRADTRPPAPGELKLLDDEVKFPWAVLFQWAAVAATVCAGVVALICERC